MRFFSPSSFLFNDTSTTEIYTLSLHDALPIYGSKEVLDAGTRLRRDAEDVLVRAADELGQLGHRLLDGRLREIEDRKSTRLNSSHITISYAVFCLKKKKKTWKTLPNTTPTRES